MIINIYKTILKMSAPFQQAASLLDAIETTPIQGVDTSVSEESFFSFSNPWLWLILVILLGAGGGYWYYKKHYANKPKPIESSEQVMQ
jgi:hypothetical protein